MRIVLCGGRSMVGPGLARQLTASGHEVVRVVEHLPRSPREVRWSPADEPLDPQVLDGVDAVINLSGAALGRPWTRSRLELLYASRLYPVHALVRAMRTVQDPPALFISQSGYGYYGNRFGDVLREDAGTGTGLAADICRKTEEASLQAPDTVRTIVTRTGIDMDPSAGVLHGMLRALRLGVGGPVGTGRQWWPWITADDHIRALEFLLTSSVTGPVNVCSPGPATMTEILEAMGAVLDRPVRSGVPDRLVRLVLGDVADDVVLASARMVPDVLLRAGFEFDQATVGQLEDWVRARLGRPE